MERTHMSSANSLDLTTKYYPARSSPLKPTGLWYSINNEWLEWCSGNMPDWVKGWSYLLEMDMSDILILSTTKDLKEFNDAYMKKLSQYCYSIDWWKVSRDYPGIEIQKYHHLKWMSDKNLNDFSQLLWLYGWDVSGGCVWDLSLVKAAKRKRTNRELFDITDDN